MDGIVAFELFGGLDPFPSGGDFDEDALFGDADRFVESDELFSLSVDGLDRERKKGRIRGIPLPLWLPCRKRAVHQPR